MQQSLLHIAFKNFITKCGRLLHNVVYYMMKLKCIPSLHNGGLLHNVALHSSSIPLLHGNIDLNQIL